MASPESKQTGTRPKGKEQTGYGEFLTDLKNALTIEDILPLMTVLEFKPAEFDKVHRSSDPGHKFIDLMRRKGIINRTSISTLLEKLGLCGLYGVADDVNNSFKKYQSQGSQLSSPEKHRFQRIQSSSSKKCNTQLRFSEEYDPQPRFSKEYDTQPRLPEEYDTQLRFPKKYDQGFQHLLLTLELLLTRSQARKLATFYRNPAEDIDSNSTSDTDSHDPFQFIREMSDHGPTFQRVVQLIFALEHETVGLNSVAAKLKHYVGLQQPKNQPTPGTVHPTQPINSAPATNEWRLQFVTELKNKYNNLCGGIQPAPFLRDRYDIDKLFVEGEIEFLEDKNTGKWTKLDSYMKIFTDPRIKSNRRIIHGEPGHGKTTLALQLSHDWCQGKTPMANFEILILLRLREFRNAPTVYNAIKRYLLPKDSKLTEYDIKGILDSSTAIILLDGFDEYPDRENEDTDIAFIIKGDMCQECEVVLTTRTSCLPPLFPNATKVIRLTGFDDAAREMYVRNMMKLGSFGDHDEISKFVKEQPVHVDFCKSPLFFTMISYMVNNSERFRNLQTVTEFFRHIIKCFHSHQKTKGVAEKQEQKLNHSELDKVSYVQFKYKIPWEKANLRDKIGKDLYDQYVRIGILIEEDIFDHYTLEYKTETRFFHKLLAEWYAAYYLAKVASHPKASFDPWMNKMDRSKESSHSLSYGSATPSLKSLDPHEVHYMYRFACGLNRKAALKIIEHLGTNEFYTQYTLLCITEWGGNLEEIWSTVCRLCSRTIYISDKDSFLNKKSTVELIKFASLRKIPVSSMRLWDCLDSSFLSTGELRLKSSDLSLPVMTTLNKLEIYEYGREITEEEMAGILRYSARCLEMKELCFEYCLPPQYITASESMAVLGSRGVEVKCFPNPRTKYVLDLESGQWMFWGETPMADYQYDKELEAVRQLAGWRMKLSENDQKELPN